MGWLRAALTNSNNELANEVVDIIDSIEVMATMLGYKCFRDGSDRFYFLMGTQIQIQLDIEYMTMRVHGYSGNPKVQEMKKNYRYKMENSLSWKHALLVVEKLL